MFDNTNVSTLFTNVSTLVSLGYVPTIKRDTHAYSQDINRHCTTISLVHPVLPTIMITTYDFESRYHEPVTPFTSYTLETLPLPYEYDSIYIEAYAKRKPNKPIFSAHADHYTTVHECPSMNALMWTFKNLIADLRGMSTMLATA
jgi:hypothetical protein